MNKIFVGNLDFRATEENLKSFCDECGISVVEVKVVNDRYTGRSRGFGFVELAEEQDLEEAIAVLNGKILNGRPLRVDKANEPRRQSQW
ncbi:MAG: RNA recognition motif domain-containing protein [Acidobacteriota bacterium]